MNTTAGLAEQAATRELAALVDGPCALAWYWRTDLEAQQDAGRYMRERYSQPLSDKCHYRPTEGWIEHPTTGSGVRGRVWTYQPAADTQDWSGATHTAPLAEAAAVPTHRHLGGVNTPWARS